MSARIVVRFAAALVADVARTITTACDRVDTWLADYGTEDDQ